MNLAMQLSDRVYEWSCRTVDHMPLRLTGLRLTEVPVDLIPRGARGLNLSNTEITNPDYPAEIPAHIRNLQHDRFQGTTLRGLHLTDLHSLVLQDCPNLESLESLPLTLKKLTVYRCPVFKRLPDVLPPGLEWLTVDDCPALTTLPPLPPTLTALLAMHSGVTRLPRLPDGIERVYIPHACFEARLLDFQWGTNKLGWPILVPPLPVRAEQAVSLTRTLARTKYLKEELMMAAWHPKRVEAWLTQGEEVLDMMMGC